MESRNAERVRLRAERAKLKAANPGGLADAWAMIEDIWAGTVARARELPEPVLHEQVEGEWSFVQTHRHLVLATDCWLRRMVKGIARPYHPWGLGGSWLTSPRRWGIDLEIGAGRGSITRWLSDVVGPAGRVIATDLQKRMTSWRADSSISAYGAGRPPVE